MVPDSESSSIHDDLDETPNAFRFGVYVDQQLVSTLRVHHVTEEMPWSPSTKAFGDIVYPMLAAGDTFVCPGRFASDPDWTRVYPHLPYRDAAARDDGLLPFRRALRPVDGARGSLGLLQAHVPVRAHQRAARLSRRLQPRRAASHQHAGKPGTAISRAFRSSSRRRWNGACCSRARPSGNLRR